MEIGIQGTSVNTLIINLDELSIDEVLNGSDSALAQAVERLTRSVADEDDLPVARFSNFV